MQFFNERESHYNVQRLSLTTVSEIFSETLFFFIGRQSIAYGRTGRRTHVVDGEFACGHLFFFSRTSPTEHGRWKKYNFQTTNLSSRSFIFRSLYKANVFIVITFVGNFKLDNIKDNCNPVLLLLLYTLRIKRYEFILVDYSDRFR